VNYYQTAEPPLGASCVCAHKQNARKEQEVMHEPCGYFRLYGRRSPPFEKPSRSGQGKIPMPNLPPVRQTRIMGTHWDGCILHMTTPLHLTHRSTPGPFTTTTRPPLLFLRSVQTRTCLPSTLPARTFLSDCHNTIIMTSCFCLCYRMIVITIRAVL
jgi:hypothetical protein